MVVFVEPVFAVHPDRPQRTHGPPRDAEPAMFPVCGGTAQKIDIGAVQQRADILMPPARIGCREITEVSSDNDGLGRCV